MNPSGSLLLTVIALTAWPSSSSPIASQCGKPADVVFVIDSSSSIWPVDFTSYVLPFVQNVVSMFDVGLGENQTRVGIVTFSTNVHLEFHLNSHQDKASTLTAISSVQQRPGDTYTDKALKYVSDNMFNEKYGGRPEVAHIVVVLTDGRSRSQQKTAMEAENLRQNGAIIFAIGVGKADDTELHQIASQPSSNFRFKVTDFAALESIKMKLALKACEVNTLQPTTAAPTDAPTPAAPATECGGKPADIFFVLDTSSSIWKTDFEKRVLGFVRDVVLSFDIGPQLTRVGVMTFSDTPKLVIGLDAYSTKQELLQAISPRIVRYTLGGTNTGEALRDVRTIGFHQSIAREGVVKIAIVITDGQSWNEKKTLKEAGLLKESGVKVYAVGVGKAVKQEELEAIANQPSDEFVFSVNDFEALSEIRDVLAVKTCGQEDTQSDQPVCASGPVDVTFAFDASTLTPRSKHQVIDQIQHLTSRLSSIGGDVRVGVTSGPCPPGLDFPPKSPQAANNHLRHFKKQIKSNILGVVKQWRYEVSRDRKKPLFDDDVTDYDYDSSVDIPKKGLVILLNRDNVSEIKHLTEEILLLTESGVEVMVVIDESVDKWEVDKMIELVGHRRVLSGVNQEIDYSGYVMEFMCSL